MRLIDADALIEWIDVGHLRHPTELCFSELDVVNMINQQPTIEPEPIRSRLDHELSKEEYERLKKDLAEQPIMLFPKESEQPQWIPCSERLPERGKDVLVTRDYDGREDNNKSCRYVEVASCYGEDDDITWSSFSDEYKMKPRNHHVVAWMPLPEPWKGETDD